MIVEQTFFTYILLSQICCYVLYEHIVKQKVTLVYHIVY